MDSKRAHFICPVRGVTDEVQAEIDAYADKLVSEGWVVHNPKYSVDQSDPTGFNICTAHLNSMMKADMVFLFWDSNSKGSHFDLGMALALGKPLTLVKCFDEDGTTKSYIKVIGEVIRRQRAARPKVYLAGPIMGCTDNEAGGWRREVTTELEKLGFETYNPFARDYRGSEDDNVNAIVTDDKKEIMAADYIIANCPKPSAGTSMEVFLSWQIGKAPITIAQDPVSPWIRFHSYVVVNTLDEAIAALSERYEADRAESKSN